MKTLQSVIKIFLLGFVTGSVHADLSSSQDPEGNRLKRQANSIPLIYPYGATYKLLIGFSSPVQNLDDISLAFAVNFQYQYLQFMNISELSQYYLIKDVSREERDLKHRRNERLIFYRSLESLLDSQGMNGPDCVFRAICEAAQYPVTDQGLIGEIVHILLTPDYGRTPFDDDVIDEDMSQYRDAATVGRQMFSCAAVYSGCPEGQGLMELLSVLVDE